MTIGERLLLLHRVFQKPLRNYLTPIVGVGFVFSLADGRFDCKASTHHPTHAHPIRKITIQLQHCSLEWPAEKHPSAHPAQQHQPLFHTRAGSSTFSRKANRNRANTQKKVLYRETLNFITLRSKCHISSLHGSQRRLRHDTALWGMCGQRHSRGMSTREALSTPTPTPTPTLPTRRRDEQDEQQQHNNKGKNTSNNNKYDGNHNYLR